MPDLGAVLASLGGEGAKIFQAEVDAVGVGTVTIRANGGTFTDVPYLAGGFFPFSEPAIDDAVYVIGQKDWGLLVIGRPAPGPDRGGVGTGELLWDPSLIGIQRKTGAWVVPTSDAMPIAPDPKEAAVYFFDANESGWTAQDIATASFYLEAGSINTGEAAADWAYLVVGLHANSSPTGIFTPMANLETSNRVRTDGWSGYISIPLDWASRLLRGEAKGIYIRSVDFPLTISGPGTLRLTYL